MTRQTVHTEQPPKPQPHYEIEQQVGLTAEGEEDWKPLHFIHYGRIATYTRKGEAVRAAKQWTKDRKVPTRVVKVTA